ncbi:hypothetical protein F8M41_008037 [Gigaspora margarita]|uniref:Uncharacterized protein n=1 Tax=Gigaspora margarita TaxID=4874 RepID=A0A8H3X4U3_GIGMA|nr:hypothetical protein F8M41_008037 [Gigaspora margarita]
MTIVMKSFLTAVLGIPLVILILLCPILEIVKYNVFQSDDDGLKFNSKIIEYFYLAATLIIPGTLIVTGLGHRIKHLAEKFNKELIFVLVYWTIIAIIYTIITNGEIEDVPFTCPENHDYKSPNIRKACFVRSTNLVCMWLFVGFATLWEVSGYFGIVSKVEDLEYTFLAHEPEERAPLAV